MSAKRKHECVYTAEAHHSDDMLQVWHGCAEPTYVCGYHEMRWGLPGTGRYLAETGRMS